jgi:acylphosphatase
MAAKLLRIFGKVQGVHYRGWMSDKARELGLKGAVANRFDGSVLALVIGDEDKIQALAEFCKKGPGRAVVERVELEDTKPLEEFTRGFKALNFFDLACVPEDSPFREP